MAIIDEAFEAGGVSRVGLLIAAFAVPLFFPALRPGLAPLLKSAIKLVLEGELVADDALTDRLVDASVDCLLDVTSKGSDEQRKQRAEAEVNRFVSRARAGAHRRGWNEQDVAARYRKHLVRMDRALARADDGGDSSQRAALAHAGLSLARHRQAHKAATSSPAPEASQAERRS